VILSDLPDVHDNHVRLGFVSGACDQCQGNCAICVLDVPAVPPQSWVERANAHELPTCCVGGTPLDTQASAAGPLARGGALETERDSQLVRAG
jgi:hypothetical protein